MKIISICDDQDICIGLQLAGIEGNVAHIPEEFSLAFNNALIDRQVAIVVITKELAQKYNKQLNDVRLNRSIPLIVEL